MSAVATVFRITRIVSIVRDKFRFIDVCREYECTAKQIIVFLYLKNETCTVYNDSDTNRLP